MSSELKLNRASDPQSLGCDRPTERGGACKQLHEHWRRGLASDSTSLLRGARGHRGVGQRGACRGLLAA
eukprot:4848293-Lingulodinium_polyedra.AAC.1